MATVPKLTTPSPLPASAVYTTINGSESAGSEGLLDDDLLWDSESGSTEMDESYDSGLTEYSHSGHKDCTDVSVENDATYCIEGVICSGHGKQPSGYACPQVDEFAVHDCTNGMRSFTDDGCVAPVDSACRKIHTGAWGCAWEDSPVSNATDSTGGTTAPENPSATESTMYKDCTDVSVEGDATYCVVGIVCSGDGNVPTGDVCPQAADVAVADCTDDMRSFLKGECVAPIASACRKIHTGAWGCVWEDSTVIPNGDDSSPDTPSAAETTVYKECTDVSVEGDATYCISGVICSGEDQSPTGDRCPVSGDVAVSECEEDLPSFKNGKCVAPSDGVCQKIETGAWGCVWSGGDSGASYLIDTSTDSNTTSGAGSGATIAGAVGGVLVAAVIAVGAITWSRKRRNQQYRDPNAERMDTVMTPPGSTRGGASFHRV